MKIFKFISFALLLIIDTALLVFGVVKSINYRFVCCDYWFIASLCVVSFLLGIFTYWMIEDIEIKEVEE